MTVANRRERSRRGSGEDLRAALVAATAGLLETHDLDDLSVRTVTAATGVSPTALYLHFADLHELLRAVKTRFFSELRDCLLEASSAYDGDARGRVRVLALAYLEYARAHAGRYAVMFHAHRRSDAPSNPPPALVETGWSAFEPLIAAVGDVLPDASADVVRETALELWLALHGRAQLSAAMPWFELPDEDRYVDRLVDHMLPQPA
jgi:AcrR family transcriptional regulator